jgi:hypothetical protein
MSPSNLSTVYKPTMPDFFLSLAPATSTSSRGPAAVDASPRPPVRRSSSLSSDSSAKSYRVLKLAPVHLGEHANDHKQDWYEVAVEE